ncbi:MAG: type II toxin-antitoxin system CcdA family antitoxin [Pseudomonadota bacterium]
MKRAINLTADEVLLDEAKSYGLTLSEVLGEKLEARVKEERARRWQEKTLRRWRVWASISKRMVR